MRSISLQEITVISDTILEELLNEVREYIWFLYQVSETISHLDLITSLATVSCGSDYCKVCAQGSIFYNIELRKITYI